ncbi:MAG TPA: DUF6569 family protein [Gemmatimonadaceae bacterium]|nr:DUF6569 family protein [Gemmatimonadaceae bacterium]
MTPLLDAVRPLRLGDPVAHGGLAMFPLLSDAPETAPGYLPLRDALAAGTLRITEVTEGGAVPQLAVVNEGELPVLLVDGEELVGAKQNRIVNLTILVPAGHALPIPVSCVEAGRWRYASREFAESKQAMFAGARARKARDVTRSLRESGERHTNQAAVWDDIAAAARSLNTHSETGAMSDVYARHDATLEGYERAFAPRDGQVGALFAVGEDVVGLDLFDAPATLRTYLAKLVRSYALDALVRRPAGAAPAARATELLERVTAAQATTHPAVGLGQDLRLEGEGVHGGALLHEGRVVHLGAFSTRAMKTPRDNRPLVADMLAGGRIALVAAGADALLRQRPRPPRAEGLWDRVEGMLLGLAIGDALGNTSEGMNPGDRRARFGEIRDYQPNRHAYGRRVGVPSDDTQMAFWTLEHLLEHDGLVPGRLAERFTREPIFGIGSSVRAFVHRLKDERLPWQAAGVPSAGNGALMRIAPVLVPHLARPSGALWADVMLAASLTHNDPGSTSACVAFVRMLWELLSAREAPHPEWWLDAYRETAAPLEGDTRYQSRVPGDGYAGPLWRFVDTRVRDALRAGLPSRHACDGWYSGAYLLETVPSALYILAQYAHDPEEAIVRAVNDTRDNDTVAAIVGAAVGALHGRSGLPPRWADGLLGRTGASDDGRVFALIDEARVRWDR